MYKLVRVSFQTISVPEHLVSIITGCEDKTILKQEL